MLTIRIYTRFGSNSPIFLRISRREWRNYQLCWEKISPYFGDDWTERIKEDPYFVTKILFKSKEHFMQSIVFSAMCLEAFIYDYAANNFTDTYAKKYLDKLDIASKWVIIPKMITGKDFPTDSQAFQDLQRLIKERNNIVHSKSTHKPRSENLVEILKTIGPRMKKDVETEKYFNKIPPHEIVIEVLQELRKLEGENDIGTQWWQLENTKYEYDEFKHFKEKK